MNKTLVFTFISVDKPGVVESIAVLVKANGGNWQQSHMTKLAGKFAGIVQVTVGVDNLKQLEQQLLAMATQDLLIQVDQISEELQPQEQRLLELSFIGQDREGILHEVSYALAKKSLNVVVMETKISSAPMSGELLFNATATIALPAPIAIDDLHQDLEQVCNKLDLDWRLEMLS